MFCQLPRHVLVVKHDRFPGLLPCATADLVARSCPYRRPLARIDLHKADLDITEGGVTSPQSAIRVMALDDDNTVGSKMTASRGEERLSLSSHWCVHQVGEQQHRVEPLVAVQHFDARMQSTGMPNVTEHLGRLVDGQHVEACPCERLGYSPRAGTQVEDGVPTLQVGQHRRQVWLRWQRRICLDRTTIRSDH